MTIRGSCLCGTVAYEIDALSGHMDHCHCSNCRKVHGAAFGTYATFATDAFRWTRGAGTVKRFRSSDFAARWFCPECGSPLAGEVNGNMCFATVGSMDDDPGIRPQAHIFFASRVPWHTVDDELVKYDSYAPGMSPDDF